MEAEGIAMRPGPRPVIAPGVLPTLRRAILGIQLVVVRYTGPDAAEPATRILSPYGILYGGRGWLVAHVDGLPEMRLWRLDRIVSADLLDRGSSDGKTSTCQLMRRNRSGCFRKSRSMWCWGSRRRRQRTQRDGCSIHRRTSRMRLTAL
jgi:predicted DNA-binding transcriptional regulator YafY